MEKWKKTIALLACFGMVLCFGIMAVFAQDSEAKKAELFIDSVIVDYGDCYFRLPVGYGVQLIERTDAQPNDNIRDCLLVLYRGDTQVGTLTEYAVASLTDNFRWVEDLPLEQWSDKTLGYMAWGNLDYGYTVEFFSDVPDGVAREVLELHTLYLSGNSVYDFCLDELLLDETERERILSTVSVPTSVDVASEKMSQEEANYQKCAAVMDSLSWYNDTQFFWINSVKCQGNETTKIDYLVCDEDSLMICQDTGAAYERQAVLLYGDEAFSSTGHENQSGELIWQPCEDYEYTEPWLASFSWNKHFATYLVADWQEDVQSIRYRVNAWFDEAGEIPEYFATFFFDGDGTFLKVQLDAVTAAGDSITVTETIVTQDAETIQTEIQREYRRVQGEN